MALKVKEHGIGIAIKRAKKKLFIEVSMLGKLTHEDYQIFVPMIDKALKKAKGLEVDLLVDMRAFKGWEMKAAWDDLKFGLKHRNAFDKMAIVGDRQWEEISVKMMAHFMAGKTRFFKNREKALSWLLT
ncbi:STAS/SEC14 domain-containing protein [Sulfurovum sp. ST-21]|uniref:STAS/SEC14 domain-containing protein n=1 Tax=Sulfurovum indicum TaxID=2779528 RepID=A0A7M1S381_9BACT|nr:STAS/SEC14 domain-containing protein [Sulfurovum indicum]QOR61895.1 STAS/SEC14 domain-containing protein [Sulfurovum indicum]